MTSITSSASHNQPKISSALAHTHHLLCSNQNQTSSNLPVKHFSSKTSSPDPQQSTPSIISIRPVGGIGESPFRQNQPHLSTSYVISTTLNTSRLFNKLPPCQRTLTQPLTNTSILSSSTNASTSQKTHKKDPIIPPLQPVNHLRQRSPSSRSPPALLISDTY
ncbi:hypothetical protein PGTUg99_014671 [Puccinia graminis f. sp. tritici]|uniref:Uncharacterized protein n=1 Tax=Puccinia graminis f. sp. tritici TaxID=56615 RepID=A0A5B0N5N8_PUCGR|nr:hypothetical protein PGTUg99_014671 [Puccinia graminis f. sp. tritici]